MNTINLTGGNISAQVIATGTVAQRGEKGDKGDKGDTGTTDYL